MPRRTRPDDTLAGIDEALTAQPTALDALDPAPAEQREPPRRPPRPRRPAKGPYQKAVEKDLARLPDELADGAVAAGMIRLAVELDTGVVLGRDAAAHVREIRQSYSTLRELAPAGNAADVTDEVTARREERMTRQGTR